MKQHNINMENVRTFVAAVRQNKQEAFKTKKVEGEWVLDPSKPQFRATLSHGSSTTTVQADAPFFLGGEGRAPDPVQYCLFGMAACFAQTFATIATEKGIILKNLVVSTENKINLTKSLGLSDEPIVESVTISVHVETDADDQNVQEIQLARERCSGVYGLTHAIPLRIRRV